MGEGGSVSPGSTLAWAIDFACGVLEMTLTGALLAVHGLPSQIISGAWIGLVVGMLSIAIGIYATAGHSLFFEVLGLAMGGYALFETLRDRNKVENMLDPSAREILSLSGFVSTAAVVVGAGNLINEALHE